MWILLYLIVGILSIFIIYIVLGLYRTEYAGPSIETSVIEILKRRLWWIYGIGVGTTFSIGYYLTGPVRYIPDPLVPSIMLGLIVGRIMSLYRMRYVRVESALSEEVKDDFPSDRLARMLHNGSVPPLPAYLNLIALVGSYCIGLAFGTMLKIWF